MKPFRHVKAIAAPIDFDNVDNDQVIPARFMRKPRLGDSYAAFLLHDYRFNDDGTEKPDFVLNQPPYRDARIIVASKNYGCGSSRLGAVYVHLDYGIRSIIAVSFGDVFFNNCLKNGILCVRLPEEAVQTLRGQLHDEPGVSVAVDLDAQNVTGPDGTTYAFEIDAFAKRCLLDGLTDIDLTLQHLETIERFEQEHHRKIHWIYPIEITEPPPSGD